MCLSGSLLVPPLAARNWSWSVSHYCINSHPVLSFVLCQPQKFEMIPTSWIWFFVFMALLPAGFTITCYECNSHDDERCLLNDNLPKEFLKDCSEHATGARNTMCRKIVQDIEFAVNNNKPESRTIRTCGWDASKYLGTCYQRSGYGGRQEVCSCTSNNCNHSSRFEINSWQLIASLFLVMYFPLRLYY